MDYRNYTDLDFAANDYFVRWVRFPDIHSNHFWEQWIKDHPHKEEEINRAKRLLLSVNMKPAEWEAERQIKLKQKVMQAVSAGNHQQENSILHIGRKQQVFRIAAAFAICFLLAGIIGHLYFIEEAVYYTANNETKEVVLPDGSVVKMNTNTRLSYKKYWWSTKRNAVLEGEAFFKVKHDENSLFTVYYGKLHARVLGTSFNIRAYKGLEEARITVLTGKVEVGEGNRSFGLITPNKEVVYKKEEAINVTRDVDAKKISEWNNAEVNLFDVPFSELVFTLQQVYKVKIDYPADALKETVTTIHFKKDENLTDVLKVIETIHHLKYSFKNKGEVVFINK